MSSPPPSRRTRARKGARRAPAIQEPRALQWALIAVVLAFLVVVLFIPLATVFVHAFRGGISTYLSAIQTPETISAIRLTLITAAISVPLNVVFGVAAAWLIARFRFRGRRFLIAVLEIPFSVSPVISGLLFVLLFGRNGPLGEWLTERGIAIIFAVPGIVLATTFVTLPFVAREVLTQLQAQGTDPEEAALSLGASGWQVFFRVTLPRIRWSLLYGVILTNARAMGEFGAVSVVSGHVRGLTNTVPLHVEILYNEYALTEAFAVASLLTVLALFTLAAKKLIDWRTAS